MLDGLQALMRGRTTILDHALRAAGAHRRPGRRARRRAGAPRPRGRRPGCRSSGCSTPASGRALLARALAAARGSVTWPIGRVVYKPGDTVAVHYRRSSTASRATPCDRIAGVDLARAHRRAALRRARAQGRLARGRAALRRPGARRARHVAAVRPGLPALAEEPGELTRGSDALPGAEPELLGYKPRARAVLRANGLVLKAYGAPRQFEAALAGLRAAGAGPLPTGAFAGAVPELRLTAQRTVAGSGRQRAEVAAGGRRADRRAAARRGREPRRSPPERQLAAAGARPSWSPPCCPICARASSAARPARPRAARRPAARARPRRLPRRPAARRATRRGRRLRPDVPRRAALDLATYAADVVRGRDGDLVAVDEVLEACSTGYGERPGGARLAPSAAILGRAAHPFHRQVPAWPDRVERCCARRRTPVARALVTGCAGFIGSHLTEALLADGYEVIGVDCFNDNYPAAEKLANLAHVRANPRFELASIDLASADAGRCSTAATSSSTSPPSRAYARAGGAASTASSTTTSRRRSGCSRRCATGRIGSSTRPRRRSTASPSSCRRREDAPPRPLSPYGVTKLAGEQLCRVYHVNHGVDTVALRFFTVYGPRQRPDMAFRRFCEAAACGGQSSCSATAARAATSPTSPTS